jgi:hypothetical protein
MSLPFFEGAVQENVSVSSPAVKDIDPTFEGIVNGVVLRSLSISGT